MRRIHSESQFVLRQLLFIIKLPWCLLQVLFRKRRLCTLSNPWNELRTFILEPRVTVLLVTINLFVFILQALLPASVVQQFIFSPADLYTGNILPIIASWFMHASVAHLLSNLLALYIFGRVIEMHFDGTKTVLIYFISAATASIVSGIAGQGGIGASGAIAGLIATGIMVHPLYLTYLIAGIPLPIILIGWGAILADISGVLHPDPADMIGHWAHLGGYAAVSILIFAFNRSERGEMWRGLLLNALFVLLLYLLRG